MNDTHDKSKTQQRYRQARQIIPGGTQLLSKRPEMFLPGAWPAYYSKARGCEVWDLDDRHYYDFSLAGIGACPLGYADEEVNAAVSRAIANGSSTTLNSPLEVELAELLLEIHPWADMARFTRTGGEAMAVAVRIARAASGRDRVAFCGYHGWHDWYLAANLADDEALDGHLLPGLEPRGVPRALAGSALPFHYNRPDELEELFDRYGREIGVIVMEPIRHQQPQNGFLDKVRAMAHKHQAVLVFDEITAGWRLNHGGAHLMLGCQPDIAVFAKATSNGFPMAAVIGRESVMEAAQNSFISSTYWTDAVGPAAALATIRKMKAVDLPARLRESGERILAGERELCRRHGVEADIGGPPAMGHCFFDYGDQSAPLKNLATAEMLKHGHLFFGKFMGMLPHGEHVDKFLEALDKVLPVVAAAAAEGNAPARLPAGAAHSGFHRLT